MSKGWLKGLKKTKVTAQEPRTMTAISEEYTALCGKLGHAKYQLKFQQTVVDNILQALTELDREASARKQVDAETAKAAPLTTPATTEQTTQITNGAQ